MSEGQRVDLAGTSAFQQSGARSVVATLWGISDAPSAALRLWRLAIARGCSAWSRMKEIYHEAPQEVTHGPYDIAPLVPDVRSSCRRSHANRLEDAELDGVDCFRVEGRAMKQTTTVWIDKATFLVRRIDGQVQFPDFRTEETTTYAPVIDSEIAEPLLEFNPPGAEVRETADAASR